MRKKYNSLGEMLREIRLDRRMTQKQVEEASGLNREYVARHEALGDFNPSLKTLVAWGGALGLKPSQCLELVGK
jgi:transcriptional regulator with XRE-family HTH domain